MEQEMDNPKDDKDPRNFPGNSEWEAKVGLEEQASGSTTGMEAVVTRLTEKIMTGPRGTDFYYPTGRENVRSSAQGPKPRTVRVALTLQDRVKALEYREQGLSTLAISRIMGVSKTQIGNILHQKSTIMALWNSGKGRADQKSLKQRKVSYGKLDELVWEWYCAEKKKGTYGKLV